MKIDIEVCGTFCNTWPNLIVELNDEKIHDHTIEGEQSISMEVDNLIQKNNKIFVGMNNKSFGKNKIWDTETHNNEIKKDKTIRVLSIKLDGVECKDLFDNKFHVKRSDKQPTYFPDVVESVDTMNYNGYFGFSFDLPLYNSLISKKFKKESDDAVSYFSNYTKVFHYEGEKKIINEVKKHLRNINEKFGNKRPEIRNS
jgi:hypothetical protein